MSLNDLNVSPNKGTDVFGGLQNPTVSSNTDPKQANFVTDPTSESLGAGAPSDFKGHQNAKHELRQDKSTTGMDEILESSNIHPLREDSNAMDGWKHATDDPNKPSMGLGATATVKMQSAMNMASGLGNMAYGKITGDKATEAKGREQYEQS